MNHRNAGARRALSTLLVALLLGACGDKPQDLITSAKTYLAKNDNKAAIIQIKNALQANPDLPEARYLLALALLDGGDPAGAEAELRKAIALKYSQDSCAPALAKAMLAQGHAKQLSQELGTLELGAPSARADLQMSLMAAYAAQGQTEMSQAALTAALRADPGYVPARLAQARQQAGQRGFDEALVTVDDVIAKAPASFEAWKLKGDLLLHARQQAPQALDAYRKAVEIKPDFLPAQTAVTHLLLQQGQLAQAEKQIAQVAALVPKHPQVNYLKAQLAYQRQDLKLARDLLQELLRMAPSSTQGLQLAGAVDLQLNALASAESHLSRAVQLAPNLPLARRLLVMTYLRLGQTDKAMAALLPGLNGDASDPELMSVAGEVYLHSGDLVQAQRYFAKAVQLLPKDGKKRTSLALTRLMSGQVDAGMDELLTIAGTDHGITADLALVNLHLRRREFDKALQAISGLEKKQPTQPLAAQLRARTLLAKGDPVGARKSFEQALAIDPGYFAAVVGLGGLDIAEKKPLDARKRFEALLVKEPNNSWALLALAEIATQSGGAPHDIAALITRAVSASPLELAPRLALVNHHLRIKDAKAATLAAQNGVAALPNSADMLEALGRAQQVAGEFNQAIASYNKLVGLQPRSVQSHVRLAEAYMADQNKPAAARSLRKALDIKPDYLPVQRALVGLEVDAGHFQDALTIARAVQKQRPKEPAGYALEGDVYAVQKNWELAAAAYRAGLRQLNASGLAMKLHAILLAWGKLAEADKLAISWQKDQPKDASFVLYLGDQALVRKDYAVAEKMYAAVVRLQPSHALAYNNLAWVSAKLKLPGALGFAQKANALVPDQPAFMDTLAALLAQQGDYAQAVVLQNKAVALQPGSPLFRLNLAKIHIQGGNKDLARQELEALGKLGTQFSAQAEVAALLSTL
jgi:cellulose synthase operon protein C